MADVAVVEHPHHHEEEEHVEWEHPDKGYFDEDDGTLLSQIPVCTRVHQDQLLRGSC